MTLIGHWPTQDLQARQPIIEWCTSLEKSYSPRRLPRLLRSRFGRLAMNEPAFSSRLASLRSTPWLAISRNHSRTRDARPFGEWMRSRVPFHDGHMASLGS
ncbi:hypothetical protein D9M69_480220 [compost metagenome]